MFKNIYDRHRKAYRAAAPDTLLPKIKESATEDTIVTSSYNEEEYLSNFNEKMNNLNIKSLMLTGQLEKGKKYDLDYDNQIIEHEKWDAKRTYKHTTGHFAGIRCLFPSKKRLASITNLRPFFPAFGHSSRRKPHSSFCRTTISPSHDVFPLLRNDQSLFEKGTGLLKER